MASFFFASAVEMASLMILFASCSAEPIAASAIFFLCKPPRMNATIARTTPTTATRITIQS